MPPAVGAQLGAAEFVPAVVEQWPNQYTTADATQPIHRDSTLDANYTVVVLDSTANSCGLRSLNLVSFAAYASDGNGNSRRGSSPADMLFSTQVTSARHCLAVAPARVCCDFVFDCVAHADPRCSLAAVQCDTASPTGGSGAAGYTGLRWDTARSVAVGSVSVDRRDGGVYIGWTACAQCPFPRAPPPLPPAPAPR